MRHDLRLCGQRNLTVGVVTGSVVLGHSWYRAHLAGIYRRVAKWLRPPAHNRVIVGSIPTPATRLRVA